VKRAIALGLVVIGALATQVPAHAQEPPPDIVDLLNEYFASDASAGVREQLGYARATQPIVFNDARNDQTHPVGEPTAAASGLNDIVGGDVARLSIGDNVFRAGSPMACDRPMITCSPGSDPDRYRDGAIAVRMSLGEVLPLEPFADRLGEYAAVLRDPNGAPWEPLDAFPLDGFTGMTDAFVLSGGDGSPWTLRLRHHDSDAGAFVDAQTDARALRIDDDIVFFFPPDALDPYDGIDLYAFTSQGAPTPDLSAQDTVRTLPGGPPTPFDASQLAVVAPLTTTTAPTETTAPEREPVAAPPQSDDSGGSNTGLWAGLAIGGGVLLLGGAIAFGRANKQPVLVPATGDGGALPPEALTAIGREFGATAPPGEDHAAAWEAALFAERAAQERLLRAYADLVEPWVTAWQRFRLAAVRYAEAFLRANAGSEQLQQLARDWQVRKQGAQAADLAVAIIQIVRGVGKLGAWGWRWLHTARTAAAPAAAVAQAAARAQALIDASPTLQRLAADLATKGRSEELLQIASLADEAGMTADELAAVVDDVREVANIRFESLLQRLDVVFLRVATKLLETRGFVRATAHEANAVQDLLNMARSMLTTRGTRFGNTAEQLGALTNALAAFRAQAQANPGFLEKIPKLYSAMAVGDDIESVGALCTADDLALLDHVLQAAQTCGDDLSRFGDELAGLVGPASVTGTEVLATARATTSAIGDAVTNGDASDTGTPRIVGSVGSVDAYLMQFGIAGDSLGGHLWDFFTSPIESTTGLWTSLEGVDAMSDFLQAHQDDLVDLGPALADAIGALEQLSIAVRGARLDDPNSTLGGAGAHALRAALDAIRSAHDAAPPDWRELHSDVLRQRIAHIEQKLATIERTKATMARTAAVLPQLTAGLDALRRSTDGTRVGALELLNPDIAAALARILTLLEGTAARAFAVAPAPLDLSPEDEAQVQAAIEAHRRMLAGEEVETDWEIPDFSDLPPATDD
jgi:hypothetical protein